MLGVRKQARACSSEGGSPWAMSTVGKEEGLLALPLPPALGRRARDLDRELWQES